MNRFLWLAVPLIVFGAVVTACGGDSKTVDIPGGGKVSVSDKLPGDFPDDFPKYKGAKVLGSISGGDGDQQGTLVTFETGDSVSDVEDFYKKEFEDGPWKSASSGDASGFASFLVEKGDTAASVFISEVDGKTTILITYGDKSDLGLDDSSGSDSSSDDATKADAGDDDSSSGDDSGDSGSSSGDSSGSGDLPDEVDLSDDFPKDDVPLPSGARVTSSSSFSTGGNRTFFIEFYTKDEPAKVSDFYEKEMPSRGWENSFSSNSNGEVFTSFTKDSDPADSAIGGVTITIAKADVDGYSVVSMSVSLEPQE
jgi:hypothetical protein